MPRRNEAEEAFRATVGELATRAQLDVLEGGREVVQQSAPLWRRVTDGAPCGFCAMLASRGPVYGSRKLAGADGRRYHSHCGCTAEPFDGAWEDWEPTPEEQWFEDAYAAVHRPGMTGEQAARLMDEWMKANPYQAAAEVVEELAPRIDWEALTTSREIADKLAEVMKDTGTVTGLDNPRHAVEKVRDAAATIADLVQRYPQVKFNLTVKPVRKNGVIAQASGAWRRSPSGAKEMDTDTLEMIINSGKLSKASAMGAYPSEAERKTFFWSLRPEVLDVKTFDYVVRHEFGHLVDFYTQNYTSKTVKATSVFTEVAKAGGLKPPPRYFYRAAPGNSPESVANFDAWNAMLSTERSVYGRSNDAEGIAEAFADVEVNGAYASQTSRIVVERLLALLKEAT